jgi:hypothetical protein
MRDMLYPASNELWRYTFAETDAWRDRFAEVPSPTLAQPM